MNHIVQYYVEGEDEKKLIDVLKTDMRLIIPGKVQKLNVVEQQIKKTHFINMKNHTMVVLVFDTDTGKEDILNKNIEILMQCSLVSEVVTIPQVKNLEDELIRCCDIKDIKELLGSKSKKDFKKDFIKVENLKNKLLEHKFEFKKLWIKLPENGYKGILNKADKIRNSCF